MKCPCCGSQVTSRAIYYGLPVSLCLDAAPDAHDGCHLMWGFWSWPLSFLPFNGSFMIYRGSYWRALWRWWQ